ncbi:hypothetical protein [Streptomyces sp. SID13726]|uniref:hypothetical protein n=1 Tax=Streptomyces sp. SID13726 TaxID=2706058 RepID=UPI0013B61535|nr:hypothetical protein [Streptomyces sp. SID13726]NEB05013.1 hypothetical protein [Streptomyces sp. SID13726]
MHSRGRVLRLTTVMAVVLLALTGFSTGHKSSGRHKSSHRDGDSGGGCSSSRQDHDSYSTSGGSGGGSSSSRTKVLKDGSVRLVSCATKSDPYSTAEVTNPNSRQGTFKVSFSFDDKDGHLLSVEYPEVTVDAKGTETVRVMASAALLKHLDHCQVEPEADRVN